MSKLSAHGQEIGRINFTTYSKAYFQDGTILRNSGFGWKIFGKCKADPQEVYQNALAQHKDFISKRPGLAKYHKALHSLAGMGKAWKLHTAIQMLGDDVDGIWSEACDGYGDNVHASVEEVQHLVNLYAAAVRESERLAEGRAQQTNSNPA